MPSLMFLQIVTYNDSHFYVLGREINYKSNLNILGFTWGYSFTYYDPDFMIFSPQAWGNISLIHSMLRLILFVHRNDENKIVTKNLSFEQFVSKRFYAYM